jgi:hypothetical protein
MICPALNNLGGGFRLIRLREQFQEYLVRPGCQLTDRSLNALRQGKDRSIDHMLEGGNGFPEPPHGIDPVQLSAFDMGCVQERRDLRALRAWENSRAQCMIDKQRGVTG